jgi:hypothetical protein
VKNTQSHIYDLEFESTTVGGVHYKRDHDGVWRYSDTWLPVPGARDLTLTERFEPKLIVSSSQDSQKVERVVVSGDSVRESPELLGWCLELGTTFTGPDGELVEVFVPYASWQERDRVPGAMVAPEHSEKEAERALAEVERKYREADQALEVAAEERAEMLRRYADRMTRQEARAITGLSVGRIQQLIRREKLNDLELSMLEILDTKDGRKVGTAQELAMKRNPRSGIAAIDEVLRELIARGLIRRSGPRIQLTAEGREMLPSRRRSSAERPSEVKAS